MLDLMEKLQLQVTINDCLNKLDVGIDDLLERLDNQKQINDAPNKLDSDQIEDNSLLRRLLAGEFNQKRPMQFWSVVKKVYRDIQKLEPIKEAIIQYAEANKGGIFESVLRAAGLGNFISVHRELVKAG